MAKLVARVQAEQTKYAAKLDAMKAIESVPARIGDLFMIEPLPPELCLYWLVIHTHPDDPTLLYCAPVDDTPLEGVHDATLALEPIEMLSGGTMRHQWHARCGNCLWLPQAFIDTKHRTDTGFSDWAKACRRKVRAMLSMHYDSTEEQEATDNHPDYWELMEQVETARAAVEERRGDWENDHQDQCFLFTDDNWPGVVYIGDMEDYQHCQAEGGTPRKFRGGNGLVGMKTVVKVREDGVEREETWDVKHYQQPI